MTSLIRHGDAPAAQPIRTLDWPIRDTARSPIGGEPRSMPFIDDARAIALEDEIRDLKRLLAETDANHVRALEATRAQARKEADLAYERDDARALALLQAAIAAAVETFGVRLAQAEPFAALLCQTALAKVFSHPENYRELVSRAISRQIAGLRLETVIAVDVSPADFQDEASFAGLGKVIGSDRVEIRRDPQLASGDCRIDLRLGHIEISLPRHWDELQALLRRLASDEAPQ